ncbi:G-type lectin S-receptor-like serine/threonine-protein kinase CES101 [Vigna unguiculata]|uniref:G-type lectin S-receptor-like serine/threonine-protein kinase CES101 n=1 Tax=Vigna unguiculata TaxID=3917 RepID=UPI001016509E|nr:G-type lectin S-receptor-like serine/threonine-protein kinase CES101 [Vigna unguiculata]
MMLYSVEAESNKSVRGSLLDTGNFVLHEFNLDGSVKRVLWQSFDYPTDTILPGMKLGYDKHSGHKWSLTARRSYKTLWSGSFSLSVDPKTNQLVSRWRGDIIWTSGEWRNGSFSNLKSSSRDRENFNFSFFSNESVTYYEFSKVSGFLIMEALGRMNASGVSYSCVDSEIVAGCTMPQPPKCREDSDLYLPSWNSFGAMSRKGYVFDEGENLTISDCWMRCLKNCSCEAYSYAFKDATGCEIWSRNTSHFVETNSGVGRPIFFFLSETTKPKGKKRRIWIAGTAAGVLSLIVSFIASFIMFWRKQKETVENRKKRTNVFSDIGENTEISDAYDEGREQWNEKRTRSDTHKFDFITILQATDNFSLANKIGEGGFGPVYKGKLANGQEIAIKRLSKSSGQGLVEFRNEAMLIVKLQHTNLVRLLGFCIDREERILVYEYMANKSLNLYLFDANKRTILDWKIRYKIIEGIAQGLVYLHQYSRLKVIHRDLKASNILLDNELNPKISDFGMARILKWTLLEEKTNRVVGT